MRRCSRKLVLFFSFDRFAVKIIDESINTYHTHTHARRPMASVFFFFCFCFSFFLSSTIFLLMRLSFVSRRSKEDNETEREKEPILVVDPSNVFSLSLLYYFSSYSRVLSSPFSPCAHTLSLCLPSMVFILRACTLSTACVDTRAHTR